MSRSAITMLLLALVSVPVVAFWVERVLESQIWYMTNPGVLGGVIENFAPSWFLLPVLFVAQLIIVIAGWTALGPRSRVVAILLVFAPIPALLLPLLLVFAFQ